MPTLRQIGSGLLEAGKVTLNTAFAAASAMGGPNVEGFKNAPKQHSPIEEHEKYHAFINSMKIPSNLDSLKAFETYKKTREVDYTHFKDADGKEIVLDPETKKAIENLAKNSDETKNISRQFDKLGKDLEIALKDPNYNPLSLINKLTSLRSEAESALKAQFEADKAAIDKLVIKPPANSTKLKEDLQKSLLAAHTKASDAVKKSITENLELMHKAAQHERNRISVLANMRNYSHEKTRAALEELIQKKMQPGATIKSTGTELLNVEMSDVISNVRKIKSVTGTKVELGEGQDEQGNKVFTVSRQLPNRTPGLGLNMMRDVPIISWITAGNFSYYNGVDDHIKADLLVDAKHLIACGCTKITTDVYHPDPKHAQYLAKKAYAAALEAGFDPDKITININGQTQPILSVNKTKDDEARQGLLSSDEKQKMEETGAKLSKTRENMLNQMIENAVWKEIIDDADETISITPPNIQHQLVLKSQHRENQSLYLKDKGKAAEQDIKISMSPAPASVLTNSNDEAISISSSVRKDDDEDNKISISSNKIQGP